ncbi:RNA-directed DNA polymerase (reverse transcriptase)-related family protein [Rhynchospora pubera]|uniref:RNA-directed DNA polymerase (Reverse transcriptase)-related family protein n=1 Tax=Rhynchospora pubera TaxID=906938 RepID=A0AAV8F6K2_9POAL|nr:RNA-directed DNA polymerase (reverse transcriptase)-related family protein [Rhynchospora pubera]
MPGKLSRILNNSYRNAKVTVRVNGAGDGFIIPTQGLRQGCPMSPYAFIMAMEILTRALAKAAAQGRIKGIMVAEHGPTVTYVIYADDLVIMGDTTDRELIELTNIMTRFGNASGLVMNPAKSKIWLSKKCDHATRERVQQAVQAEAAQENEKYLGAYLKQPNSANLTGKLLVERMNAKLAGWKSSMLSHAGRLVLIKSALASLPVYYMTTEQIPKKWLKEMTGIIAKFLWGKVGKTREYGQVRVADLYDHPRDVWRVRELNAVFGQEIAEFIHSQVSKPVGSPLLTDKLIWLKAKKGKYKQGYEELQEGAMNTPLDVSNLQWVHMWKWEVMPKVKVFIWRLLSKTLPVA